MFFRRLREDFLTALRDGMKLIKFTPCMTEKEAVL